MYLSNYSRVSNRGNDLKQAILVLIYNTISSLSSYKIILYEAMHNESNKYVIRNEQFYTVERKY